jgi:predicted MPP superfamily phosphohydrolase
MQGRKHISRRDFLKILKIGAIDLTLLAVGGGLYSFFIEPGMVKVETVGLKLPRLTPGFSGIRIAQISDIHMGGWVNADRLRYIVDLVVDLNPDLLLITGDFLIGHAYDADSEHAVRDLKSILTPLTASIPSYAVLGNHDYWTNPEAVREMLQVCNILELTNTVFTMTRGIEKLHLCGVDDIWEGDVRLDHVLSQIANDGAAILLAHEPDFADVSASTGRFDLQVSGHSHGGQVVIPFIGPPLLPYLGRKYPSGLYQVGTMYQYTSRGVGMARLPVRFNCPPEITLFILRSGLL